MIRPPAETSAGGSDTSALRRTSKKQRRDAGRTREAVLDAAERLFAERGYAGASMEEIGAAAGVARSTPSYFFGSKAQLYATVLTRIFDAREEFLTERFGRALARLPESPRRPDAVTLRAVLEEAVDAYSTFLVEWPSFVKLMDWEAVTGAHRMEVARRGASAVYEMLAELLRRMAPDDACERDIKQLLISFVSLQFFPLGQADTLLRSLELDPYEAQFIRERKQQVVELMISAIGGPAFQIDDIRATHGG